MKTNVVKAMVKMVCMPAINVGEMYKQNGRAQTVNDAVFEYIKDCFCDTVRERSDERRAAKIAANLEYFGKFPLFKIQDGDDVYVNIINGREENLSLETPIKASSDALYITVALNEDKINGIYIIYGCDYALYENGTDIKNPKMAIKEITEFNAGGKYELIILINDDKYASLHMQNRLEAETLAQMGRGLSFESVTLKNGKPAKLYTADIG